VDRSLNSRSNVSMVDLGSFFTHPTITTSPLPPQIAPNCGAPPNQVPLPSPEGCGPSPSMDEYARGRRNQGETQEVGDPGASRKRTTTQVVTRFSFFSYIFPLKLGQQRHRRAHTTIGRLIDNATDHDPQRPGQRTAAVENPNAEVYNPTTTKRMRRKARNPTTTCEAQRRVPQPLDDE